MIFLPDLDCVGRGVMISETSESSFSSSSSRLRLMPRLLDAPALLPLGLPPLLPRVPPRPRPRPRPEPRVEGTGVLVMRDASPVSGVSTLILGFLVVPRALLAPALTPLMDLLGGVVYCCGATSMGAGAGNCDTSGGRGLTIGGGIGMGTLS